MYIWPLLSRTPSMRMPSVHEALLTKFKARRGAPMNTMAAGCQLLRDERVRSQLASHPFFPNVRVGQKAVGDHQRLRWFFISNLSSSYQFRIRGRELCPSFRVVVEERVPEPLLEPRFGSKGDRPMLVTRRSLLNNQATTDN